MLRQTFSRAGSRSAGARSADLIDAILDERPELRVKGVTFYVPGMGENPHTQGNCAHTVYTADEVFKSPKLDGQGPGAKEWISGLFEREWKILKLMEGSGLPVPQVTHVGEKMFFYGMKRMRGIPAKPAMEKMSPADQKALGGDVGRFVAGMEKFFADKDISSFPPHYSYDAAKAEDALALPYVRAMLGRDREAPCRAAMKEYLPSLQGRKPVMIHSDLHWGNILIDPETKRLTGVIDFGSAHLNLQEAGLPAEQSPYTAGLYDAYTQSTGQKLDFYGIASYHLATSIVRLTDAKGNKGRRDSALETIDKMLNLRGQTFEPSSAPSRLPVAPG